MPSRLGRGRSCLGLRCRSPAVSQPAAAATPVLQLVLVGRMAHRRHDAHLSEGGWRCSALSTPPWQCAVHGVAGVYAARWLQAAAGWRGCLARAHPTPWHGARCSVRSPAVWHGPVSQRPRHRSHGHDAALGGSRASAARIRLLRQPPRDGQWPARRARPDSCAAAGRHAPPRPPARPLLHPTALPGALPCQAHHRIPSLPGVQIPWLVIFTVLCLAPQAATCFYLMLAAEDIEPFDQALQVNVCVWGGGGVVVD